ncbi:polyhydroxyalkanoate synthesis repressor PhaR [Thiotrichales bacterium 19S11-10]|nr:polyhydroxyalkanoate synthesis repressor PhaR [Thiotrichales bacterium 19S11-10]MCF6807606.1 polyhydroxyalkanoate synthesis repressor PhaR [Thiotrichales bacterium 19S9-11]MCF6811575.1 polyhydroxyalkanoate synthesis repressor PhaR [Thiotrichales bacterium 19S9-12]
MGVTTNGKKMKPDQRVIKKYPNRRLYDTAISSYITLDDVRTLVLECEEFSIIDSKSKEDITRTVLMQIINEQEESSEKPMFTNDFLQQIIRSYGNSMQDMLMNYFDESVEIFLTHQKNIQDNVSSIINATNPLTKDTDDNLNPMNYVQSLAQKNLDLWQKSWQNLHKGKNEKR